MTKPFHKDELVARIHAIVAGPGPCPVGDPDGGLKVNLDTKTVDVNGQRVHLTGKEYQMLELLSLRKGTTLTKEMFLNHLYGGMDEPELKIIDVFICCARSSRRRPAASTISRRCGAGLRAAQSGRRVRGGLSRNLPKSGDAKLAGHVPARFVLAARKGKAR